MFARYIIQRSILSISICSADHIWLKHIALSPSISYCTYMPVCGVWQVHARAFFRKAFCAQQNRNIVRSSVGPTKSFAPDFQGRSHDIFCQICPNLSVLPSYAGYHFPHPLLLLLLSHQYGEVINEWMDWQFVCNLVCSLSFEWTEWYSMNILVWNLKFRSSKTAGNVLNM